MTGPVKERGRFTVTGWPAVLIFIVIALGIADAIERLVEAVF